MASLVPLAAIKAIARSTGYPADKSHLIRRLREDGALVERGKVARGQTGNLYLVESLPPILQGALQSDVPTSREVPAALRTVEPTSTARLAEQVARLAIIQPILDTPKGSRARAERTREVAAERHDYPGGAQAFAYDTLRTWVGAFERAGFSGLLPKPRSDRGKRRVLITREWDDGIDLPEDRKRVIADDLAKLARSMVANDGTSGREVLRLCAFHLARRCEAAGSALAPDRLRALCALNHKWARRQGCDRFLLVHMHDRDHKAWQDSAVPRIRRKLHDTPMGLLIGDVHFVDILVAENHEPVRVRLIAWLDASSLFAWVTPVFLSKGKGVRQEDVAEALSQVAFCPHGGIPQEYYLDNGSEYSELATAMARLSNLAEMQFGVTMAKPYSPTSKGEIEGFFNILEGIFRGLPGWIGGDRTNKRTENKGKVVQPYGRGLDALAADIRDAVRIYNDRPQSGRLAGLSPVQALDARIRETGFSARVPSDDAFDLIFSRRVDRDGCRTVRQGMITIGGALYHAPSMDDLPVGARVEAFIPLRKGRDRVFLRHDGDDLGWAELQPIFAHGDRDGARRQGALEKGRADVVKRLRAQTDPTVSTFELQKAAVRQVAPAAGDPEGWTYAIDKTLLPPSPAERDAAEDAERRALMEDFLAMSGKGERPAA